MTGRQSQMSERSNKRRNRKSSSKGLKSESQDFSSDSSNTREFKREKTADQKKEADKRAETKRQIRLYRVKKSTTDSMQLARLNPISSQMTMSQLKGESPTITGMSQADRRSIVMSPWTVEEKKIPQPLTEKQKSFIDRLSQPKEQPKPRRSIREQIASFSSQELSSPPPEQIASPTGSLRLLSSKSSQKKANAAPTATAKMNK